MIFFTTKMKDRDILNQKIQFLEVVFSRFWTKYISQLRQRKNILKHFWMYERKPLCFASLLVCRETRPNSILKYGHLSTNSLIFTYTQDSLLFELLQPLMTVWIFLYHKIIIYKMIGRRIAQFLVFHDLNMLS